MSGNNSSDIGDSVSFLESVLLQVNPHQLCHSTTINEYQSNAMLGAIHILSWVLTLSGKVGIIMFLQLKKQVLGKLS